ncbi:hypothetical protein KM043_014447 [Ampulex compressa]|nr:hypothetical protein KM043_014447 [Ampulex compressa]
MASQMKHVDLSGSAVVDVQGAVFCSTIPGLSCGWGDGVARWNAPLRLVDKDYGRNCPGFLSSSVSVQGSTGQPSCRLRWGNPSLAGGLRVRTYHSCLLRKKFIGKIPGGASAVTSGLERVLRRLLAVRKTLTRGVASGSLLRFTASSQTVGSESRSDPASGSHILVDSF